MNDLEKLNRFTRRPLTEDEVFLFDVILCDNDIDRDRECFSETALDQMKSLFIGKTGIFDHDLRSGGQTARIFDTEIAADPSRKTRDGRPYSALKARAYMVRTESNADLIREIEGGIKKEVSVSCCAAKRICSICGAERNSAPCAHVPGRVYGDKTCCTILDDVQDAYEWSFVAVPAQMAAGVTKHFSQQENHCRCEHCSDQTAVLLGEAEEMLRAEVVSLCARKSTVSKALCLAAGKMNLRELMDFRKSLLAELPAETEVQLLGSEAEDDGSFRMH